MLIKFPSIIIRICFFDDYSENSMESRAEDNKSITSKERDENSSESSGSEEEQSSITTENSSEEEIDPWTSKRRAVATGGCGGCDTPPKKSCRQITSLSANEE